MSEKKSKNIVIIALCITLIFMGVGFAALSQTLTITGTATVTGTWEVRIDDVNTSATPSSPNQGVSTSNSFTSGSKVTDVTVAFTLVKPGDSVVYDVSIGNYGSIQAVLDSLQGTDTTFNQQNYVLRTIQVVNNNVAGSALEATTSDNVKTYTVSDTLNGVSGNTVDRTVYRITYTLNPNIGEDGYPTMPPFNEKSDAELSQNNVYQVQDTVSFTYVQASAS